METTSSKLAIAINNPCKICSRRWALFKSNLVRLVIISLRCFTYAFITSFKDKIRGRPSTMANIFTGKEVCNCVCLNRWFSTTWAFPSRFTSITKRIPRRSDSSRMSEISVIFLSRTKPTIVSINEVLFTWYGISVTIMASRPPLRSSISVRACTFTLPRPVSKYS